MTKQEATKILNNNTKWFYDDLYGVNIYIKKINKQNVLDKFVKAFNILSEDKIEEPLLLTDGKCLDNLNGNFTLILRDFKDLKTVSHEVIHLVFGIFENAGIPINIDNDETFAYYYSYLLDNILLQLKNEQTKIKNKFE